MKMLDDLIGRCDAYLKNPNTCDSDYLIQLFADTCIICSRVLEEKTGYVMKEQAIMAGIGYADVRTLRKALESCREQYEHEMAVSGAAAAKDLALAHSEAAASVDFSVSQTISMVWDVPEETLSSEMKAEISKPPERARSPKRSRQGWRRPPKPRPTSYSTRQSRRRRPCSPA